jgi:hypothetical protein
MPDESTRPPADEAPEDDNAPDFFHWLETLYAMNDEESPNE